MELKFGSVQRILLGEDKVIQALVSVIVEISLLHSKFPERGISAKAARISPALWGPKPGPETLMTKPEISGIAPLFIVKNVTASLAFYRDRLGSISRFRGPNLTISSL